MFGVERGVDAPAEIHREDAFAGGEFSGGENCAGCGGVVEHCIQWPRLGFGVVYVGGEFLAEAMVDGGDQLEEQDI